MGIGIAGLDVHIVSKFLSVVLGEFSADGAPQKLAVFVRSQIHSYAYHLVSVRGHDQRVRSPIQGFSRCEGISFTPAFNKNQHSRGFRPKNAKIISLPLSPRQLPRPRQNANSATSCKHGAESMHTCSIRHLLPGQRSADDIAVRADGNLVQQLALRW